ncbi:MAG TPA: mannosyltransferase family protein [Candidatus Binataceae bacterium]|nr:mannosyltransferase family protein [Candidatus Binataceae bacterium]
MNVARRNPPELIECTVARPQSVRISGYAIPVAIFLASRLVVFLAIVFAARLIPPGNLPGAWNAGDTFWRNLLRWDSGWYLAIMRGGYHYVPDSSVQQSVAFFPLYPALSWCVAKIFQVRFSTASLIVSNTASIAAVVLLYRYVREHYGARIANGAVALLSFFPASIFLSAGYTESLAMALTMAAFIDLEGGRHLRAALWCGLLTATRPTGIVMLAPLAYCMWPRPRWTLAAATRLLLGLGIAISGLAAFCTYLGLRFGAPLACVTSQSGWNNGAHWSLKAGLYAFAALAQLFRGIPLPSTLDPWVFVAFAAVIIAMRSELSVPELLMAGASFAFLAVTWLCAGHAFLAMSRYMIVLFPAYIAGAKLLDKRPWLMAGLCVWMAMGLSWYAALFAQWHWVD